MCTVTIAFVGAYASNCAIYFCMHATLNPKRVRRVDETMLATLPKLRLVAVAFTGLKALSDLGRMGSRKLRLLSLETFGVWGCKRIGGSLRNSGANFRPKEEHRKVSPDARWSP